MSKVFLPHYNIEGDTEGSRSGNFRILERRPDTFYRIICQRCFNIQHNYKTFNTPPTAHQRIAFLYSVKQTLNLNLLLVQSLLHHRLYKIHVFKVKICLYSNCSTRHTNPECAQTFKIPARVC